MNYQRDKKYEEEKAGFLEFVKKMIAEHGIPEKLYVDTGKSIIILSDNTIKISPAVSHGTCKVIDRVF